MVALVCGSAASRPKHLLVFINPLGGKGQGKQIYERKVAPLFTLASITTEVIGKATAAGRKLHDSDVVTGREFVP